MVKLRTLGECLIEVGDNRIAPDSKVVFALLLYLGLARGKRFTRSALMEMFWPSSPQAKAAHSLRQTIYQCRKLGAPIEVTKTDVQLRENDVASDLDSFEPGKRNGSRTLVREFLPSYTSCFSESYASWLDEQRSMVGAKIRRGLLTELTQLKTRGDWEALELAAGDLLKLDPLNEEATLVLAEAAAMRGNKVGAVRILERFASEVGGDKHLQLPATILRKRIGEQFKDDDLQRNPFVGRSDTLEFLNRQLDHAKHGDGSCLLVWGEPGMGKSRLVSEFHKTVKLQGFQTVKVECQVTDANRPLSAFVEAVPPLMQLRGSLGCSPQALALLTTLTNHAVDDSGASSHPVPEDGAVHLTRAIIDLLDAILVETPLVLIVEDVHWLDASSWETIARLAKAGASRRLLLVLTSREQFPRNVPDEVSEGLVRFPLKPLADIDAHTLFYRSGALTHGELAEREERWFITAAEGNPYFVRELARHFADTGQTYAIPPSLESLLSGRLRQISSNALRLLQVCALLGRHSTFDRIERVLQTEPLKLLEALEDLEFHELVLNEGTRVSTRHALLADQALKLCSPGTKRLLHRRIAGVLEVEVLETQSATLLWTCADHLHLAGESARAMKLALACARHLLRMGLTLEAVAILEHALAVASSQTDRHQILQSLSIAYRASKNWPQTVAALKEATSLRSSQAGGVAIHDDDELRLIEARWFDESSEFGGTNWSRYVAQLMSCVRSLQSTTLHRLEAARSCLILADNALAAPEMDEVYALVHPLITDQSLPRLPRLWIRAIYGSSRGDLDDSLCATRELVLHYRGTGNVWELIKMLHNSSLPLRYNGSFEEAERNLLEAATLAQERSLWLSYADLLDTLGTLRLYQDRYDDARAAQLAAMSKLSEASAPTSTVMSVTRLGAQIAIAEGNIPLARSLNCSTPEQLSNPMAFFRDDALATDLIIAAETGEAVSPRLVDALLTSHLSGRENGRRDFTTAALLVGLRELGRHREAHALGTAYVKQFRRERYPIPRFVVRLMNLEADGAC